MASATTVSHTRRSMQCPASEVRTKATSRRLCATTDPEHGNICRCKEWPHRLRIRTSKTLRPTTLREERNDLFQAHDCCGSGEPSLHGQLGPSRRRHPKEGRRDMRELPRPRRCQTREAGDAQTCWTAI